MTEPRGENNLRLPSSPAATVIAEQTWLIPALAVAAVLVLIEICAQKLGGPSVLCLAAVFVASTMSSIAGFAFSAICGALLFHLLERPVQIVQIMLVCSIAIQLLSVITLRNVIDWRYLSRFVCGGVFGLPLGVYLLTHLATHLYLRCLGVFLICYGLFMLLRRPPAKPVSSVVGDYIAGFLGGVTGGFIAFPGAFVTIWCGVKGWSKDRQRGIYQPFILIMQVAALAFISLVRASQAKGGGMIDFSVAMYIPGALLGTWCGIAIFRRLTDSQFAGAVNSLLIVSGVGLLS
jgi:uncharacterized protein